MKAAERLAMRRGKGALKRRGGQRERAKKGFFIKSWVINRKVVLHGN